MDDLLKKSQQEIDRLVKNRAAFYEIMSDMIFLIREDYVIADMNRSAINIFGDLCGKVCHQALYNSKNPCEKPVCPLCLVKEDKPVDKLIERCVGDMFVEYSFASFKGYHGDIIVMIALRDVILRKQQENELREFHQNVEKILQYKIAVLDESEKIREELSREVNFLQKELDQVYSPDEMIGAGKKMREVRETIYQVADSNVTVLITGESGTGKELIADLIYQHSHRRGKPYIKFNCAAVSESLLESDLFGYEKGSFTGAQVTRKGKFEAADTGTIFLDEIGDISPKMQASLLRVLQNGEVIRVGDISPTMVDVRVIAATNADLAQKMEKGTFRKDLYYRLNVVNLRMPLLRERKEDILPLATHFIKKYREAFKKDIDFLPDRVVQRLLLHDWPGNVRELENTIQRAILFARNNIITEKDLDFEIKSSPEAMKDYWSIDDSMFSHPLKETIADCEKKILAGAFRKWSGSAKVVAQKLKIGKTALYEKMKRHGVPGGKNKKSGS